MFDFFKHIFSVNSDIKGFVTSITKDGVVGLATTKAERNAEV